MVKGARAVADQRTALTTAPTPTKICRPPALSENMTAMATRENCNHAQHTLLSAPTGMNRRTQAHTAAAYLSKHDDTLPPIKLGVVAISEEGEGGLVLPWLLLDCCSTP